MDNNKTILITGFNGFLGKSIFKKMLNLNINLYGIGRGEIDDEIIEHEKFKKIMYPFQIYLY